jgi:hypothetical protein
MSVVRLDEECAKYLQALGDHLAAQIARKLAAMTWTSPGTKLTVHIDEESEGIQGYPSLKSWATPLWARILRYCWQGDNSASLATT